MSTVRDSLLYYCVTLCCTAILQHSVATHCNTLQHIVPHSAQYNTTPYCSTVQHSVTQYTALPPGNTVQHSATQYNTAQHSTFTAIYCNIMQHSTGWRRLIGSPKLQIIFHKRVTKYTSLLQKMTYKDKGSYESSPHCTRHCNIVHCVAGWHCVVLCCTVLQCGRLQSARLKVERSTRHCHIVQHTATHCNIVQHTATHCI